MGTGLLKALGLKKSVAPQQAAPGMQQASAAPPTPAARAASASVPSPDGDEYGPAVPVAKPYLDLNSPQMRDILRRGVLEQAKKDQQEAEQALVRINKSLADAQAYVAGLPDEQLRRASYATIMADVRKRFPEAAGLSQAKTLRKKSDIASSFGFSVEGEWPAGGEAAPPAAMFGARIAF